MRVYRTRVEVGSTGYVAYAGLSAHEALAAVHAYKPWRGERVVCEVRAVDGGAEAPWRNVVTIEGGRPFLCPVCDGDVACWRCHGRGYV